MRATRPTRHEAPELRTLRVTYVLHSALNCPLLQRRFGHARVRSQIDERSGGAARLVQRLLRGESPLTQG